MILNPKDVNLCTLERITKLLEILISRGHQRKKLDNQKLLGIIFQHKLNFEEYITFFVKGQRRTLMSLEGYSI